MLSDHAVWPARLYFYWDSIHFHQIELTGYFGNSSALSHTNAAFFPAYPISARYLARVLGGGTATGGTYFWSLALIAWLGAAVAAVCLWRLAADRHGSTVATRSVILLLAGPYALFLMASYSEGMFVAFAVAAWLAGTSRRWWLAGLLATGAALTRINGGFLAVALLVMYLQLTRSDGHRMLRPQLAALALPFAGVLAYFGWLKSQTGSWLMWQKAQSVGWHRHYTWPWHSLATSWHRAATATGSDFVVQSTAEVVFAGLLVASFVALLVLRRWPEAVYVGLTTATLVTSTYYYSVPRSTVILFPVVILVAEWSARPRWRGIWAPILAGSIALLAVNSLYFLQHRWAG